MIWSGHLNLNLAEASSMTNAMQEATNRDHERERPYSAPALGYKNQFQHLLKLG